MERGRETRRPRGGGPPRAGMPTIPAPWPGSVHSKSEPSGPGPGPASQPVPSPSHCTGWAAGGGTGLPAPPDSHLQIQSNTNQNKIKWVFNRKKKPEEHPRWQDPAFHSALSPAWLSPVTSTPTCPPSTALASAPFRQGTQPGHCQEGPRALSYSPPGVLRPPPLQGRPREVLRVGS